LLKKIVSGGQSGIDRGALDAAIQVGLPIGGWCPKGRKAEDGLISEEYPLVETPERNYVQRTEWNVRDSDATLILNVGKLTGGTLATLGFVRKHAKPARVVQLDQPGQAQPIVDWLRANPVETLNVAGPRESKCLGVQIRAEAFLVDVFKECIAC